MESPPYPDTKGTGTMDAGPITFLQAGLAIWAAGIAYVSGKTLRILVTRN